MKKISYKEYIHLVENKYVDYPNMAWAFPIFEILEETPMRICLNLDENRIEDAELFRLDFLLNEECQLIDDSIPISIFETLLALVIRGVDDFLHWDDTGRMELIRDIFSDLICNISLPIGDNGLSNEEIMGVLKLWMDRKFSMDGWCSPFPMKICDFDYRNMSMWDHFIAYLNENY